jgi:hypothetical protein
MASRTKIAQRIAELSHEDIAVRRKAALKLGEYGDVAALPELCAALQDVSWKVQRNAARALSSFRDPAAVEALASVFIETGVSPTGRKRRYRSVRKEALYALGQIGTEEVIKIIDRVWLDERADLHDEAVFALQQCGLVAVPAVCRALAAAHAVVTSRAAGVRVTAAISLQSLPDRHDWIERDARALLFALIDDHGHDVFIAILATDRLTPRDKYLCLEILRRRHRSLLLTIYFRATTSYCEQLAVTAESDAVRAGARAVLDYSLLARGSAQSLTAQSDELVRAAGASSCEQGSDELVRGAAEPGIPGEEEQEQMAEPVGLLERALRLFKRP